MNGEMACPDTGMTGDSGTTEGALITRQHLCTRTRCAKRREGIMHRSFTLVRGILAAAVTAISSAYANAQQFFLAVAAGAFLISGSAAPATASPLVSWRIIHGIVQPNDIVLGVIEGALI